jgi:CDP-diacylglycerol--glycerol-3-phosphate 3-phosphatidyltransferase
VSLPGAGTEPGPGPGAGAAPAGPGHQDGAAVIAAPSVLNVANGLTMLRLGLVPVFVILLTHHGPGWRITAFVAFGVASLTDLLDGELARRRGLITDFGKIADPIADKALTGSALVTLSLLGEVAWWATAVILFREVAVTGLRFWVIRRGVIAASRGGKAKTILQLVAISLYILPGSPNWLRVALMDAAFALTLVTGVDYAMRAMRLRRAVPATTRPAKPDGPAGPAGPAASRDPGGPGAPGEPP